VRLIQFRNNDGRGGGLSIFPVLIPVQMISQCFARFLTRHAPRRQTLPPGEMVILLSTHHAGFAESAMPDDFPTS